MKFVLQILLVGVLAVTMSCPARAESASIHSASAAKPRHHLIGRWTRQKKGTDAEGVCLIDIVVEFRADGHFLYTRTFHAVDHPSPTWDFLVDAGTWKLREGFLVQQWTGNGEHPGGYTSRSTLLYLSADRLRYVEGVDGAVSYHRAFKERATARAKHGRWSNDPERYKMEKTRVQGTFTGSRG